MYQSEIGSGDCCGHGTMVGPKPECISNHRICDRSLSSCSNHQPISDGSHSTSNHHLQSLLARQLGPEYLSTRPGAGGCKLTYIEGWRIIALANEVFGYDGWNSETKSIEVDFVDQTPDGKFNVGVSAIVRIYLTNGNSHEDVGYGKLENSKSKADALDKCKKEAVTDALKRTLRTFGNLMGNCLYDKSYLNNVKTMQAQKEKFLPSKLYRPEHVAVRTTSNVTESKPFDDSTVPNEKVAPKPNPIALPSHKPGSISKLTNDLNHAIQNDCKYLKPNGLIPPVPLRSKTNLPDKRKLEEEEQDGDEKINNDGFAPLPMTLSDNYFDLNDEDLAGLELVESNELFGVQPAALGDNGSPDESGLITDTSLQADGADEDSMMTVIGPHDRNNVVSKNSIGNTARILDQSIIHRDHDRNPSNLIKTNTSSTVLSNLDSRHQEDLTKSKHLVNSINMSKFSLKAIPNQSNKLTSLANNKVIIQAGQLPTIKSGTPLTKVESRSHSNGSQDGLNSANHKAAVSAIRYPNPKAIPMMNNRNHPIGLASHENHPTSVYPDRLIKKVRTGE